MVTPVFSPISFRKEVSVKSVPQTSVQRTTATEKVLSSAARAPALIVSSRQAASTRLIRVRRCFMVHILLFYVQAFPALKPV